MTIGQTFHPQVVLRQAGFYLARPLRLMRGYQRSNLRPDLLAGLTVAVILLPQAIAFTIIAELPPQMGLYTAVIGAILGALWGSSNQAHTGPANAISLLVMTSLITIMPPQAAEFPLAAGLMAVMVGLFQLALGLSRLGVLVNFVSHSVIVGFATGAGVLIAVKQISSLLGISAGGDNLPTMFLELTRHVSQLHLLTTSLGLGVLLLILLLRRINRRLPIYLISMAVASLIVFLFQLHQQGVAVIGDLPRSLPPLAPLPFLNLELIARLSTGALAVAAIGLVETTAISHSLATQTGQRLDNNQEFVGQGVANLVSGLFSGYPGAASFSRSAVNLKANAQTPLAAVFSGLFALAAMLLLGPMAAYLPRTALAVVLIVTAYDMIDRKEMGRIWHGPGGDAVIMVATLLGTLFLDLEFAVLVGILLSFGLYIMRTSVPRVVAVLPDADFRHFVHRPDKPDCPQLGLLEIYGDLYFGAVNHIEEAILNHAAQNPEQRFLVLRMSRVNQCDFSGVHMLESVLRAYRDRGGDVYLVRVSEGVRRVMAETGFVTLVGESHFIGEDEAINWLFYRVLDPAVCIYECPVRVFRECQNLPKQVDVEPIPHVAEIPAQRVLTVLPRGLWSQLRQGGEERPYVIDVREPREFQQGHIPDAHLIPLGHLFTDDIKLPAHRPIILVCRSGRRSRRAAFALQRQGCLNVAYVEGGMLAWEAAGLLVAIEQFQKSWPGGHDDK